MLIRLQATLYYERLAKKWYSQTGSLITVLEVNLDTKTGEAHSFLKFDEAPKEKCETSNVPLTLKCPSISTYNR